MAEKQTTRLGRNWLIKTVIFLVLLLGFGAWGLVDALVIYPRRGQADAAFKLTRHLQAAQAAGMLTTTDLKAADPAATLEELRQRIPELQSRAAVSGPEARRDEFLRTRITWLESLGLMWDLNAQPKLLETEAGPPSRTLYYDPAEGQGFAVALDGSRSTLTPMDLLTKLGPRLSTTNPPRPLSPFDLPVQWLFVVIGFGGGAYMIVVIIRAASKRFAWEPQTQTLTLPGGKSFTPADLKELDKRLWHKFFVTAHLHDGTSHKLDLLRYVPLEDWVLTMERTAFPETAEPPPSDDTPPAPPSEPSPAESAA